MNRPKFIFYFLSLCCLFIGVPSSLYAQIAINNRTGHLSVTTSDGDVFTVAASDTLPKLSPGSVVEVLSGSAEFLLNHSSDLLTVVAGESVVNLMSGNQISVTVENRGAVTKIKVLDGELQVSVGETILALKTGAMIKTNISEGKASILLVEGEAAIVEFGGKLQPLTVGESKNLGPIFAVAAADESQEVV